ncbi:1693_t:CDS:2 [Gigaspora rosea]|nr:1693_t:CDS:2 [Gigaspora rosea]
MEVILANIQTLVYGLLQDVLDLHYLLSLNYLLCKAGQHFYVYLPLAFKDMWAVPVFADDNIIMSYVNDLVILSCYIYYMTLSYDIVGSNLRTKPHVIQHPLTGSKYNGKFPI